MLYIYKEWNGSLNAICDGIPTGKFVRKSKTDRFNKTIEYVTWDMQYGYDRERKLHLFIKCLCFHPKAVSFTRYIHCNERLLVFGNIYIDKSRSEFEGKKRYNLYVTTMIPVIEFYRMIEDRHSNDDIEARVIAEYRKKSRKANEINLMGEAAKFLTAEDVML